MIHISACMSISSKNALLCYNSCAVPVAASVAACAASDWNRQRDVVAVLRGAVRAIHG